MYQVTINDSSTFLVDAEKQPVFLDGHPVDWSSEQTDPGRYSILFGHRSFIALVTGQDAQSGTLTIWINGRDYTIRITDPREQILDTLAVRGPRVPLTKQVLAPMPGLVQKLMIIPGQAIRKGDPVLILEAMKMENQFNSPQDGTVKEIRVKKGEPVEKGGILFILE